MIPPNRRKCVRGVGIALALAAIGLGVGVVSCQSKSRLVEQFDNGPLGGPPGASEGYIWVGKDDHPSPGKNWRDVDPKTLTPEQKSRIHTWP
jgi:hypothetical protein